MRKFWENKEQILGKLWGNFGKIKEILAKEWGNWKKEILGNL